MISKSSSSLSAPFTKMNAVIGRGGEGRGIRKVCRAKG